nr:TolC family protein [candidate division Zixibacteria bacterium]
MRRTLLAGLLAVLAAGPSPAARQLTLREALTLAREHSFEIRRALAEEQAAGEALGAARAARLPTLDASAIAFYNTEVASLDLATSLGRLSREIGTKENVQTDLRLAFPLYTGGRIAGGVDAAQASARRQAALTEAAVDDLLYRTRVAYLTVHRSDRQIEAARSALRRAQITRAQVASLLSAGAADSVAVLEAQLAVSETELRLQQALHDRREAVIQFAQLVGLSASDSLDLATPLAPPAAPGDPDTGFVRPELAAAQAAVEIGRAGVAPAAADWFPTL